MKKRKIVGSLEMCDLPDLGIHDLQIRIDTGAKTSALHVDHLEKFKNKGKPWIRFDIHPDVHKVENVMSCESALHDIRRIKSSNGSSQERYIIKTTLKLGDKCWPIEVSLADRSDMSNLMLLGREGMQDLLVDPSATFLLADQSE